MSKYKIKKTSVETRLAIERRSAAMLPDRPTQAGFKPWDIRNALFSAIISDKGACIMGEIDRIVDEINNILGQMWSEDEITELKKKIMETGTVKIPASEWTDTTPQVALITIPEAVNGTVVIIVPNDDVSQTVAKSAKLYVSASVINGQIRLQRADDDYAPMMDIHLSYVVIKTGGDGSPMVFLGGVDSYGEEGGTASGVDETAVRELIRKIVPSWALKDTPPADAVLSVNGKTGAVDLPIPSKASDIRAEEAGAVSTHNADQNAHPYMSGRLATALDRISGHDTNIEELKTSEAERLKTADLAAKLDAYKAAQGLVSNTTSNLTNYYLKSEIYTKEEVASLVSAIPKFEIKVVTSLPTVNISLTTVYLVKDTTEGGGLYTEYIYVNGAWEELGNQSLDLSGYATDEELDNLLKSYATLTTVSELIAEALKPYATDEEVAEAIRVATVNFVTGSQVTTAINEALRSYYTGAQVDAKIQAEIANSLKNYLTADKAAELYQPKGDYQPAGDYATNAALEQGLAKKQPLGNYLTQHQSLAHLLPRNQGTENAGKIMAVAADGTVTFINIADIGVSGDVVANFRADGGLDLLTDSIPEGELDIYDNNGNYYGKMTVVKAKPKYTITWCNYNGAVLETDTVTEGDTPVYNGSTPTRAEDDQYTYTFKGWDKTVVAATADATYTATFTGNAKPAEPNYTNLAVPTSSEWKTDVRYDSNNAEKPITGEKLVITNLIKWTKSNSTEIHIKGLDILGAISNGNKYGRLYKYNSSKTLLGGFNAGSATGVWRTADYDSSVTILYNLQNTLGSTCEYISLGGILAGDADDVIITFNEPIQ